MTNGAVDGVFPDSFEAWLGGLSTPAVEKLLTLRPDCLYPVPTGLGSLAVRLLLPGSIRPALDKLSAGELWVLLTVVDLDGIINPLFAPEIVDSLCARADAVGSDLPRREDVESSISVLVDHGLLMAHGDWVQLPKAVADVVKALPLELPVVAHLSQQEIEAKVAALDERQRRIVDTLLMSGGTGITKDAAPDADPSRPIPQLIEAGVIVRVNATTVAMPREVRAYLGGGAAEQRVPFVSPHTEASESSHEIDVQMVDRGAAGTALDTVGRMGEVLDLLGDEPVELLRDGAVGVRSLGPMCKQLQVEKEELYPLITLALAAGLVGTGVPSPRVDDSLDSALAPTGMVDEFQAMPLAHRWALVAASWWEFSKARAWVIGLPEAAHTPGKRPKTIRLLDEGMYHSRLVDVRHAVVGVLLAADRPLDMDEIVRRVMFARPLVGLRFQASDIVATVDEALSVGFAAKLGGGVVASSLARAASESGETLEVAGKAATEEGQAVEQFGLFHRLCTVTEGLTPQEAEYFIVQADMTVLVPGPMPAVMQSGLQLCADVESAGVASVYRVSEKSLMRAVDAGRTRDEIVGFFSQYAVGELPQSFVYLVDDVARSHGSVRAGHALSYVRCEDEELLARAVAHPHLVEAGARLVAPTVAVAQVPLGALLQRLKDAGLKPAAEDATGASIDVRPEPKRVRYVPWPRRPAVKGPQDVARAVEAMLAHRDRGASVSPQEFAGVLERAQQNNERVTLRVGGRTHTVAPVTVGPVRASVVDTQTGEMLSVTLSDIEELRLR